MTPKGQTAMAAKLSGTRTATGRTLTVFNNLQAPQVGAFFYVYTNQN